MSARPAASYLTRFDVAPVKHPLAHSVEPPQSATPTWAMGDEEDPMEARLAEAREDGRREATEAAAIEAAAEIARIREECAAQIAEERRKWADEQAAVLEDRLTTALRRIEDELAECVSRILRPFIVESLRRQMIDELIEHIGSLVASHEMMAIKIAGPADLVATIEARLGGLPVAITYEESEAVDVCVTAEQTKIETRLKGWIDLIGAEAG